VNDETEFQVSTKESQRSKVVLQIRSGRLCADLSNAVEDNEFLGFAYW
jgi:hypothetical protein